MTNILLLLTEDHPIFLQLMKFCYFYCIFGTIPWISCWLQCFKQTVRNIRNRVLDYFSWRTRDWISLQSSEWRIKGGFRFHDSIFTYVLDGSEQPTLASRNPLSDCLFYSAKKKHTSINILLLISSKTHKILYLSPSFPGSKNDEYILKKTLHEWFSYLQPNEHDLGDAGFAGLEDLGIISSPSKHHRQLSREVAKKRIEVECTLEEIKNFRACKEQLRIPIYKQSLLLETQQILEGWSCVYQHGTSCKRTINE